MAKARKKTGKMAYTRPRLISFIDQVRKGQGYCGAGNSDIEACGDGSMPMYCTNGTIHTPSWCSLGNIASSMCASGEAVGH